MQVSQTFVFTLKNVFSFLNVGDFGEILVQIERYTIGSRQEHIQQVPGQGQENTALQLNTSYDVTILSHIYDSM